MQANSKRINECHDIERRVLKDIRLGGDVAAVAEDKDLLQCVAVREQGGADGRHVRWNRHGRQLGAVLKGAVGNGRDGHAAQRVGDNRFA